MEFETEDIKPNLGSLSNKILQNPYESRLLSAGFCMESSFSNGLNLNFPYAIQDPFFGAEDHLFSDPNYDPYHQPSYSTGNYLYRDFIGLTDIFEKKPVLQFSPLQDMSRLESDKPIGFSEFGSLEKNPPQDHSTAKAEGSNAQKKAQSQSQSQSTKKRVMIKKKNSNNMRSFLIKGQWTSEEDRMLKKLVKKHGVRNWAEIAKLIPGRLGKQCRERWQNHLRPDIKKDKWSAEEEAILIAAHKQTGNKWAEIARRIPGRSENTIKNHWNATKRRRYCQNDSLLHSYIHNSKPSSSSSSSSSTTSAPDSESSKEEDIIREPIMNEEYPELSAYVRERNAVFASVNENFGYPATADQDCHNDDPMVKTSNLLQFEVKREMDFFELIYQGII